MVASLLPLTRRAALGLALLPALRRPAVAADLKDIVSTPSGLRYVDFAPGSGANGVTLFAASAAWSCASNAS